MKKNKFTLHIIAFSFIVMSFIACDKDFATLETDIINDGNATNFDILSLRVTNPELTEVIAYTQALGPVQTNGLGLNTFGIYNDTYGTTTSSFVTQVNATSYDPVFGEEVKIDSVVLRIPYFSSVTEIDQDENLTYSLDSVIGRKKMKLRLFESNYFIRDFNPEGEFSEGQDYFSNKSASDSETISDAALEGEEIGFVEYDDEGNIVPINNTLEISEEGYILKELDENDETIVSQRQSPGIRIKLDTTFWRNKIIDKEGETVLSSQNNFADYFRGLYFKAEPIDDDGSFLILNIGAQTSNIIIYYTRLTPSATDDDEATDQAEYQIGFGPNRINFMDNDFTTPITSGDEINGDSRLYLKGGQGSLARIKLFNGDNIDDIPEMNAFETFKNTFVETDQDGNFVKSKRLINEANLVFYTDQSAIETPAIEQDGEPNRIYLYNLDNKTPLFDYFADFGNSSLPSFSKINHLGSLQRVDDEPDGNGIKYKLKITEYINDLLIRDSTNVELGLAVSINVNLEESFTQRKVQNANDSDFTTPISSIITPRGTVLHGNKSEDDSKRVYLEIYYTEPNN